MPKEGFKTITIPENLYKQLENFAEDSQGIFRGPSHVISSAWDFYDFYRKKISNPIVEIKDKRVGNNHKVFVVAEIGINHNGSIENAKKLIDMAKRCGCDAVKFQKRTPDICVPFEQRNILRETPWGTMKYIDYRHKMEFDKEQYAEIDRYCREKDILWFASPWDIKSVEFLESFDIPCYKIASAMLTNKKLLERIKQTRKPIILSTGMSTISQIKKAVDIIGEENLILLHCTSTYPLKDHEIDLSVIKTLKKYFNCPIGYSGHEPGLFPSIVAAAQGACVIERHITLDRSMYGGDQAGSLEEPGLQKMIREIHSIPNYLGSQKKRIHQSEIPIRNKLRSVDDIGA
jgi:sialic acid synthase SpsE